MFMGNFGKNVSGSDTFYKTTPFKSLFFVVDTVLLAGATTVDLYIFARYYNTLTGPAIGRLLGVLLGMWLLWAQSLVSHRKIQDLLNSHSTADSSAKLVCEQISQITASKTHSGMFFTYLLITMLLIQLDYLLWHMH